MLIITLWEHTPRTKILSALAILASAWYCCVSKQKELLEERKKCMESDNGIQSQTQTEKIKREQRSYDRFAGCYKRSIS